MHNLENKKTGEEEKGNLLYSDNFGGEDLWGAGDDLYTIWGVYSISRGFENIVNYDLVSELTFRIYDKIPIRMFYEISKQTSIGDKIILEDYSEGDKSFEEDAGIDPLVTIKSILESIGLEKLITISV